MKDAVIQLLRLPSALIISACCRRVIFAPASLCAAHAHHLWHIEHIHSGMYERGSS